MPTIKQKQAVNKLVENRGNISKTMKQVGYTDATAKNPKNLTDSKGFQKLLSQIDDKVILSRLYDILNDTDKRSALSSADMLLKLKNLYPDKKLKIESIDSMLNELRE